MADFYVLSLRQSRYSPVQSILVEFEDVIVESCNAALITPDFSASSNRLIRFFREQFSLDKTNVPPRRNASDKQVLIVSCSGISDCRYLNLLPNWRERFDVVVAYVFDSFIRDDQLASFKKSNFKKEIIDRLDCIFVPMTGALSNFSEAFSKVPTKVLPAACDVLKFGRCKAERGIDLIGYGRQNTSHNAVFEKAYNSPGSDRLYYYTSHLTIGRINDFYAHRRFFWNILHNSNIALAYDAYTTSPDRFNFSFVAPRWFECFAAGCLVLGRRPTCPEAQELMPWEDATIEIPDNEAELIPFVEHLLNDTGKLKEIQHRNYINALAYHDWRHRIVELLGQVNLNVTDGLREGLDKLALRQKSETGDRD